MSSIFPDEVVSSSPSFFQILDFKIRAEDKIQLHTPDGRLLNTHIASIEFLYGEKEGGRKGCRMAIMLPRDIVKNDVPSGTEVWLL
jgi:hypothetical protein